MTRHRYYHNPYSPSNNSTADHIHTVRRGRAKMSLTEEKIINDVYHPAGLSKNQSRRVVEKLFEIIKRTLENGESLLVSGFGKFMVREKTARRGRNPQTSEELRLRERKVVVFETSGVLREKINEGLKSSQ